MSYLEICIAVEGEKCKFSPLSWLCGLGGGVLIEMEILLSESLKHANSQVLF